MTERQRTGDEATTSWRQRGVVRWLVALAVAGAVYGLGAVVWHWLMGKSWNDSLSFALTMTMSAVGGQWLASVIRRKTGRDHG